MSLARCCIFVACAIAGFSATADERVIWACKTNHDMAHPILHLVERGGRSYVKFSSQRIAALFQTEGDTRAWYWHPNRGGYYQYGVILGPDGRAWFHDFAQADTDQASTPLDYFICESDADV